VAVPLSTEGSLRVPKRLLLLGWSGLGRRRVAGGWSGGGAACAWWVGGGGGAQFMAVGSWNRERREAAWKREARAAVVQQQSAVSTAASSGRKCASAPAPCVLLRRFTASRVRVCCEDLGPSSLQAECECECRRPELRSGF
jgi:hypothetical protein